jgi:hypothetical protein
MSEVVRDPDGVFACPRCGLPVIYKGRGRRPVWCSSRCRVEASIERRGNRMVGVEPRVVTVVSSRQHLAEWERNERQRSQAALSEDAVIEIVAEHPFLLARTLERLKKTAHSTAEAQRRFIAERLVDAAHDIAPEATIIADPGAGPSKARGWKRSAAEWATLLDELATQLGNGHFYSRDLPTIDQPLSRVAELYVRRRAE